MSQAADACITNVVPFRRVANDAALVVQGKEAVKSAWGATQSERDGGDPAPTPADIHSVLIACMITGLTDRAKLAFYARLQKMYDRAAGNPERQAMVKAAADVMLAPLNTAAC